MGANRHAATRPQPGHQGNPFAILTPAAQATAPATKPITPAFSKPAPRKAPDSQTKPIPVERPPQRFPLKTLLTSLLVLLFLYAMTPISWQKKLYGHWKPNVSSIQANQPSYFPPVAQARITSPFGPRWGRQHQGVDLAAPSGASIQAVAAGKVIHSGWEHGYGKSVVLDHGNGRHTRYAHCSRLLARQGASVKSGQIIARIGSTGRSTGPHLHFEVIINGQRKNPVHYYPFFAQTKGSLAQASH